MRDFYEFFAGGGMARAGLGSGWRCAFANDIDPKKIAAYKQNWEDQLTADDVVITPGGVEDITTDDLPGTADLAWASFPCQDLSLAGSGAGLGGDRSGTFWPFWRLMEALAKQSRSPRVIVLENVCGALTSHGGEDFSTIGRAIAAAGYHFGTLVIDAARFVPQSRPRLFFIAVRDDIEVPGELSLAEADPEWRTSALVAAHKRLPRHVKEKWIWWALPAPPKRNTTLADLIESRPKGVKWHTEDETQRLLDLMSSINLAKVSEARKAKKRVVGTVYKRMRPDSDGVNQQRAEVRFDDIAGCLRTPRGGSSRQTVLIVEGSKVRSRLLSPREAARLMGLDDDYKLPKKYNDAYHLAGDGVAVPVVRHIAENLLNPILTKNAPLAAAAE